MKPRPRGVIECDLVRTGADGGPARDHVVVEEPLEIRIAGDALATTMRTPGHDRQLALGFLFSEGIIRTIDDVASVVHCGRPGDEGFGNVIDVAAAPGANLDPERLASSRRGTLTTAACGVCGRRTIDDLLARCSVQTTHFTLSPTTLSAWFDAMRAAQTAFALTGGIHAAALFGIDGQQLALHEDIGRHNAVDKVVGEMLLAKRVPASQCVLLVSGRASFEMVQKAVVAGIPFVASVSAASSLAIDVAKRTGTTLAGFVRSERFNVYSGEERVQ